MGIFDHSSRSTFVRSGSDVGEKAWLAVSALIHLKGVLSGWGQDSKQASQVPPHMIHHSREHVSNALESSGGVLYTTASDALHCTWWWLGCSCLAMETHSMKLSTHCSWANLKTTQSLEVCSYWLCRKLATSAHCAPQHVLTPLCDCMWPTTLWLSCSCSQLLPLCYDTTNSWPWNI